MTAPRKPGARFGGKRKPERDTTAYRFPEKPKRAEPTGAIEATTVRLQIEPGHGQWQTFGRCIYCSREASWWHPVHGFRCGTCPRSDDPSRSMEF